MGHAAITDEIKSLDPVTDHQRICFLTSLHEFPWDTTRSLELALFRAFAVAKGTPLLAGTGEFTERTQKRYDDTVLLLAEILEHGYDSERGRSALRRINQMHRRYEIPNDEFLYVLSTFIFEPIRWNERFGWRPLLRQEKLASFYFWREIAHRMAIRDVPEDYEGLERYYDEFPRTHYRFAAENLQLAVATRELLLGWYLPRFLRPLGRPFVHAMLDDELLRAVGLPRPHSPGQTTHGNLGSPPRPDSGTLARAAPATVDHQAATPDVSQGLRDRRARRSLISPREPHRSIRVLQLALLYLMAVMAAACGSVQPAEPTPPTSSTPSASSVSPTSPTQTAGQQIALERVTERAAHTGTTLPDGSVFVAGGCVTDGCSQASAETFLLMADGTTVVSGPSLAGPRDGQTATPIGDDVILVGGYSGEGRDPLATIEVFRSSTGTIESAATMSLGRGGHAAAALGDGTVLIVAGWVRSRTPSASAVIFDPVTNTATDASDLPIATDGLDAVSLADGRALVTGGLIDSGLGTDQTFIFDPATGAWTSVGPMLSPRFKHFSVLLDDGRVLVIGGTTDDRMLLSTTEIFDPSTSTFSAGPDLHEPRYKMTGGAVVLDRDRVLIAGGGRSVEIVNVQSGNTMVVDSFSGRGSFATLNAWGSESFIVLGGYDDRITLRREFLLLGPEDLEAVAL